MAEAVSAAPARAASAQRASRLWEIDVARTVAIAMMVAYHVAWDVDALAAEALVDPFSGGWRALQVACGSSFLAITGATLAVMNARARARGLAGAALYRRHARRAVEVTGAALLVSAATLVALGDDFVRFGILHCIAAAMFLGPALVRLGPWLLPLAAAVLWAGLWASRLDPVAGPWLLPLGVPSRGGAGVDWYPLLPWLAPFLAGLWLGRVLYPGGERGRWAAGWPEGGPWAGRLGAPGRHALPIYLLHQPVLLVLVAGILLLAGVEITTEVR